MVKFGRDCNFKSGQNRQKVTFYGQDDRRSSRLSFISNNILILSFYETLSTESFCWVKELSNDVNFVRNEAVWKCRYFGFTSKNAFFRLLSLKLYFSTTNRYFEIILFWRFSPFSSVYKNVCFDFGNVFHQGDCIRSSLLRIWASCAFLHMAVWQKSSKNQQKQFKTPWNFAQTCFISSKFTRSCFWLFLRSLFFGQFLAKKCVRVRVSLKRPK